VRHQRRVARARLGVPGTARPPKVDLSARIAGICTFWRSEWKLQRYTFTGGSWEPNHIGLGDYQGRATIIRWRN